VSVSGDGRYVAFGSDADNVVLGDTNGFRDIFVRDRFSGATVQVSVGTNGSVADGLSIEPSISANGRYVAFTSSADNLVPNDGNHTLDVFRRDLLTGTTALVSLSNGGVSSANGSSHAPMLAGNGRYVLFLSLARDLAPGIPAGTTDNLFCRDMVAGTTFALTTNGYSAYSVSRDSTFVAVVAMNGITIGPLSVWNCASSSWVYSNGVANVRSVKMSPNGQRIAYVPLTPGNIHALDWATGTDRTIGVGGAPYGSQFSGDGNFFAYAVAASQAAVDTNGVLDVYLYDFQFGTNSLISRSYLGGAANGVSDSPDISADGRFVAFRSAATNLVGAPDTNDVPDLFLYDRTLGTTVLLSAGQSSGAPAGNRSLPPLFSADGRTLTFQSWASDLASLDYNQSKDVFVLALLYASITASSTQGQGPTLSWPARPDETYHVQFKQNLSDSVWQEVNGTVTVTGNRASLTDLAPGTGQRFYRVVTF
jgi:Tol biopolymer transport system component